MSEPLDTRSFEEVARDATAPVVKPDQSNLDQLRREVGDIVFGVLDDEDVLGAGRLSDEITTQLMQVLSGARDSRSRQLAILNLIGLDLVGEGRNDGIDVAADGSGDTLGYYVVINPTFTLEAHEPVLVCRVRPQEEKADS